MPPERNVNMRRVSKENIHRNPPRLADATVNATLRRIAKVSAIFRIVSDTLNHRRLALPLALSDF